MKKSISILALLAIIATGAFAQGFPFPMSAGGGLLLDWSGNNGIDNAKLGGKTGYFGYRLLSIGGFGFFDATYAELDVSFAYGSATYVYDFPGTNDNEDGGSALQLGFTLLGKYPIDWNGFTLFPLLGADYNLVLSSKDKNGKPEDNPGDNSQFGILAGAGLDYPLSSALFLRGEALFHLRLPSKDAKDAAKQSGGDTTFGMGPRIKVGVGYKF
jgi:opacity protein-like surface antigen